jgi:carbon-monoxide dehydrogenase large subunit
MTIVDAEFASGGTGRFETNTMDFAFCASIGVVSVDGTTGRVGVERHVGEYDIGRTINPMIVQGQLAGAAAPKALGRALRETRPRRPGSATLHVSHGLPRPDLAEMPEIELLLFEVPTSENLVGAKGSGNSGVIGTHATIANAVANALGPSGEKLTRGPLVPDRVRALLRSEVS